MLNEREPEQIVERYRGLVAQIELAQTEPQRAELCESAARLRNRWKEWQGEDSLHEMAFGEPETATCGQADVDQPKTRTRDRSSGERAA
jgi:hypothetical protein